MAPIRHLIWDWNGTLLHDLALCLTAINRVLLRKGLPAVDAERYRSVFGFPVQDYYQRLGFDFADEPFESLGTEFIRHYNEGIGHCQLHAGVPELLAAVQARGLQQSVLSAREQDPLQGELHHFGIHRYFAHVAGLANHYALGKTQLGHQLMHQLDIAPEHLLLIGDTLHDAEVAHALGIQAVLLAHGHQSRERLVASGLPVLDHLGQLAQYLHQHDAI